MLSRGDMNPGFRLTLAIVAMSSLVACADGNDDDSDCANCSDVIGKADATNPGKVKVGTITAAVPLSAGPGDVVVRLYDPTADHFYDPLTLRRNVATKVVAGTYGVYTTASDGYSSWEGLNITVPAGGSATVPVGTMQFTREIDESIWGIDAPLNTQTGLVDPIISATPATDQLLSLSELPVIADGGTEIISVDDYLAVWEPVAANQNKVVDLTDVHSYLTWDTSGNPSVPTALVVTPSAPIDRTLPNATSAPFQICSLVGVLRCAPYFTEARPFLFFGPITYQSVDAAGAATVIAQLPAGQPVQLKRLDLSDAEVALADASIGTVPGVASVELLSSLTDASGPALIPAPGIATGAGIDVPPGIYQVTTTYTDPATNLPVNDVEVLDLR